MCYCAFHRSDLLRIQLMDLPAISPLQITTWRIICRKTSTRNSGVLLAIRLTWFQREESFFQPLHQAILQDLRASTSSRRIWHDTVPLCKPRIFYLLYLLGRFSLVHLTEYETGAGFLLTTVTLTLSLGWNCSLPRSRRIFKPLRIVMTRNIEHSRSWKPLFHVDRFCPYKARNDKRKQHWSKPTVFEFWSLSLIRVFLFNHA